MKGGRTAPRNYGAISRVFELRLSFNEGGADCPPKPVEMDADLLSDSQLQ